MERDTLRTQGDWLLYLRRRAAWTHVQLADAATLSHDTISHIESGKERAQRGRGRGPNAATTKLLTAALAARFADLARRGPRDHRLSAADVQELMGDLQRFVTAPPGPASAQPAPIPTNLPAPLTSFVGREREMTLALRLLTSRTTRLLTLTGPGGVGKTRLALQIATQDRASYPDGVYHVDLTPVTSADRVLATVAYTLGLREADTQPLADRLTTYLRETRLLLILDNFEHVAAAAPLIAACLATCPTLSVLVTSRAPLHVRGEQLLRVDPLPLPDPASLPTCTNAATYASVALFCARAQRVDPAFTLTDGNVAAVVGICQRVDGLPLAIELAAPHLIAWSPERLLTQLDQRLAVLVGGPWDMPERQRTLRGTLAWSYDRLAPPAQALFRCLSVFAGGWTEEAAATIDGSDESHEGDIAAHLEVIVTQSLIYLSISSSGEQRFSMLETIREYGLEQLEASGEAEAVRHRHAVYYQLFVERARPFLTGPEQSHWLARVESEQANIWAALHWAVSHNDTTVGLRIASASGHFWLVHGHVSEGRRWFDAVLAWVPSAPSDTDESEMTAISARALRGAGILAWKQNDSLRARQLFMQSLAFSKSISDTRGEAQALCNVAIIGLQHGLTNSEEADWIHISGLLEQGLGLYRSINDRRGMSSTLNNLANVAMIRGDWEHANRLFEEGLALAREVGDARIVGEHLMSWAEVARRQQEYRLVLERSRDALAIARELSDPELTAHSLEGIAWVASSLGFHDDALRLSTAATVLYKRLAIIARDRDAISELLMGAARAALSEAAYNMARRKGQRLALQDAIEDAFTVADRLTTS